MLIRHPFDRIFFRFKAKNDLAIPVCSRDHVGVDAYLYFSTDTSAELMKD